MRLCEGKFCRRIRGVCLVSLLTICRGVVKIKDLCEFCSSLSVLEFQFGFKYLPFFPTREHFTL